MVKLKELNPALLPSPQVTLKGEKSVLHIPIKLAQLLRQAIFTGNVTPLFNSILWKGLGEEWQSAQTAAVQYIKGPKQEPLYLLGYVRDLRQGYLCCRFGQA